MTMISKTIASNSLKSVIDLAMNCALAPFSAASLRVAVHKKFDLAMELHAVPHLVTGKRDQYCPYRRDNKFFRRQSFYRAVFSFLKNQLIATLSYTGAQIFCEHRIIVSAAS